MSHETFDLLERIRSLGRRAAMATLVRTTGTTPRKEGTKMFVEEGGQVFGSVTIGGCVDARVIEQSADVLASSTPRLIEMKLGDEEAWEIGLTCGGNVSVFVEPLTQEIFNVYDAARRACEAGRTVAIETRLANGTRELTNDIRASSDDFYVEVLRPAASLMIFGAGAVAIPLVAFAKLLGFETVVVDARPRFATRERFPDASDIRIGIASQIAAELKFGASTPVILVAHDYKIDLPVLRKALTSDVPYIGLLGSRRRGAAILQLLREDGVPEEQLARIRVPIGLDLGGDTAAEIALSIASEIVAVMHGRSGAPLSTKALPRHEPVR